MSILDAIANPRMADIAGALDVREARIMRDEARRKEIKLGQLVAEALPGIEKDSPLYELAKNNPREYMAFAKATGIPMNNGEMMQEFVNDTMMLHSLAQQDPQQAYEWALQQAQERKKMGRGAGHLEKFGAGMEDDPIRTITGLNLAYGGLTREQAMEERKLAMQERGLDIQEKRLAQQDQESATPYYTPIQTAEGVYAFDARKGTISPAADQEGGMVVGDRADVGLQGRLAKSKTGGSETAKRDIAAQADLPKVEASADMAEKMVSDLLNHPGRGVATGAYSMLPVIPGTPQADFVNRMEQIEGSAFLQAFETLKGGGQITEIEGKKATQAINRMNRSTSKKEFDAAAEDFLSVVRKARDNARNSAGAKSDQKELSIDELLGMY